MVRPEALYVEFIAGAPRRRNLEAMIRVGRRARKNLEGAHPARRLLRCSPSRLALMPPGLVTKGACSLSHWQFCPEVRLAS